MEKTPVAAKNIADGGEPKLPRLPLQDLEREFLHCPDRSVNAEQLRLLADLHAGSHSLRDLPPSLRGSILSAVRKMVWEDCRVAQCMLKTPEPLEFKELDLSRLRNYASMIEFYRGNCAPLAAELQMRAAALPTDKFIELCAASSGVGQARPGAVEIVGDRLMQHFANQELHASDAAKLLYLIFRKNSFGHRTRDMQREAVRVFHAEVPALTPELCLKAMHHIGSKSCSLVNRLTKRFLECWKEEQTVRSLAQATAAFSSMVHAGYLHAPLEARLHDTLIKRMSEIEAPCWASLYAGYGSINWTYRALAKFSGQEVLNGMDKLYPWELMRCAWAAAVFDDRTLYKVVLDHLVANYADFKSNEWQKVIHAGVALGVKPPRMIYDLVEEKGVQSTDTQWDLALPIANTLTEMGIRFSREARHLWYSIDIVVPGEQFGSNKPVAIEADGLRFHYLARGRTLSSRFPLGKEVVKDKVLSRDFAVVHINDQEWTEARDKSELLRSRILKALESDGAPA